MNIPVRMTVEEWERGLSETRGSRPVAGIPCAWCHKIIEAVWTNNVFIVRAEKDDVMGLAPLEPWGPHRELREWLAAHGYVAGKLPAGQYCRCPHCQDVFSLSPGGKHVP